MKHTETENIYHQHTYSTRNLIGNLIERRKNYNGNVDVHKGTKSNGKENYMYNISYIFILLKTSLEENRLFK